MEKLCLVLWRERELLDTLLYRLEVEQLVLASNRTEHLMRAARDVEAVLETLRETEVLRATAADAAAAEIGCPPNPSLRQLARAVVDDPARAPRGLRRLHPADHRPGRLQPRPAHPGLPPGPRGARRPR